MQMKRFLSAPRFLVVALFSLQAILSKLALPRDQTFCCPRRSRSPWLDIIPHKMLYSGNGVTQNSPRTSGSCTGIVSPSAGPGVQISLTGGGQHSCDPSHPTHTFSPWSKWTELLMLVFRHVFEAAQVR